MRDSEKHESVDVVDRNLAHRTSRVRARLVERAHCLLALLWIACLTLPSATMAGASHTVVVIYSDDRFLPANIEADHGLRAVTANAVRDGMELFDEHLDNRHFGAPSSYEETVVTYLHDKYAPRAPEIIVVGGEEALAFVLRNRVRLFPRAPVVHMGVGRPFLLSIPDRPADVIGVPVENEVSDTIDQALRWHPQAKSLVFVTGASASDRDWERTLRTEAVRLNGRVTVDFFAGLPTKTVSQRLAALGHDTVVFTAGYYQDGAGRNFLPRDSVQLMAASSVAPIYAPYSTFIGTGIVGGRMTTFESMGRQAGTIVNALIAGTAPSALHLPATMPTALHIDWRQIKRWGIDEAKIPAEAVVHYRGPSLWDAYRTESVAACSVLLLLTGLSIRLLTERRSLTRTSTALRASEQGMTIAARAARLVMWIWDTAEDQISITPPLPFFGSSDRTSMRFADALAVLHPEDREEMTRTVHEALATNRELDMEYRTISRDSEVRWIAIRGRPDQGNQLKWLGIVLDITERKKAQLQAAQDRNAIQHLSRVSMIGQMSASIAHQLNQPLTAILANAEAAQLMLRHSPVDLAEVRQICDDIVSQVQRAANVIRQLSALFKRGEMQIQRVDLNAVLAEALELLHSNLATARITAITQFADNLPSFVGDKIQLQQVFLNLIMNAIDAMRDTPTVIRRLVVSTESTDIEIRLHIKDRGSGVPTNDLKNIFEPFWSAKPHGIGIGLSICQSIVTAHQGFLTVTNNPDGGATFLVVLPIPQRA